MACQLSICELIFRPLQYIFKLDISVMNVQCVKNAIFPLS